MVDTKQKVVEGNEIQTKFGSHGNGRLSHVCPFVTGQTFGRRERPNLFVKRTALVDRSGLLWPRDVCQELEGESSYSQVRALQPHRTDRDSGQSCLMGG